MEKITMEQIDAVKTRANVGYKEAKEVLEKFDGDVVASILYLEEINKTKSEDKFTDSEYYKKYKETINWIEYLPIYEYKKDKVALDIPVSLGIVLTVVGLPAVGIGAATAILTGHKIKINNLNEGSKINENLDKVVGRANDLAKKTKDEINKL